MIRILTLVFSFLALTSTNILAQKGDWKNVDGAKFPHVFYDASSVGTGTVFQIRVLEEYTTPKAIEGVAAKVKKVETLYLIHAEMNRYSIKSVVYYSASNKVLNRFDYKEADAYAKINVYAFPISKGTMMEAVKNVRM